MIYVLIVNLIFLMTNFPHKFPTYDKNATKRTFPALYSLPLPEQANMWHLNKHLKKKRRMMEMKSFAEDFTERNGISFYYFQFPWCLCNNFMTQRAIPPPPPLRHRRQPTNHFLTDK
jgi:hypothetical protein